MLKSSLIDSLNFIWYVLIQKKGVLRAEVLTIIVFLESFICSIDKYKGPSAILARPTKPTRKHLEQATEKVSSVEDCVWNSCCPCPNICFSAFPHDTSSEEKKKRNENYFLAHPHLIALPFDSQRFSAKCKHISNSIHIINRIFSQQQLSALQDDDSTVEFASLRRGEFP